MTSDIHEWHRYAEIAKCLLNLVFACSHEPVVLPTNNWAGIPVIILHILLKQSFKNNSMHLNPLNYLILSFIQLKSLLELQLQVLHLFSVGLFGIWKRDQITYKQRTKGSSRWRKYCLFKYITTCTFTCEECCYQWAILCYSEEVAMYHTYLELFSTDSLSSSVSPQCRHFS